MTESSFAAVTSVGPVSVDSSAAELLSLYRMMVLIRQFEEHVRNLFRGGVVPGLVHLCSGQEASATGVCSALEAADYIASSHRGHGHCLAKGMDPGILLAEILGRSAGCCAGRSGSLHISHRPTSNLGTNGIVGGGIPLAAGAALAARSLGEPRVAACFFGDGALNQGIVFEVMNMAAIWALPVLFVCENNFYGEYTALEDVTAGRSLAARGEVFDIPSQVVDGMDVLAVHAAAREATTRARSGNGPSFLICNTYRFGGHHVGDQQTYKDAEEVRRWEAQDPLGRFSKVLLDQGHSRNALAAIDAEVGETIRRANDFAMSSDSPPASDLSRAVYAD